MRRNTATILLGMGYKDREFVVDELDSGVTRLTWLSGAQQPTEAEIDAAAPAIEAAVAADAADATQWTTDRADLKAQYAAAETRLTQIRDAASPTNAQVIAAVRDLAAFQLRILKYIRRL